jgi:hypothetical protein
MPGENKSNVPPTAIIRTLPYFGASVNGGKVQDETEQKAMSLAYRRMMRALRNLENDPEAVVYVAFPQRPTKEVLDCYLIVGGKVRVRARIATWIEGDEVGTVNCWDGSARDAKWWAVLTAPVSFPPEDVLRRGFQGFRYTTELW